MVRKTFKSGMNNGHLSSGVRNVSAEDFAVAVNDDGTWEDLLSSEFKDIVPKHWLKFKPPPPHVQYILGAMYAIIMTAGVLANVCIMWLVITTKRLRTPSNYLVMNLAFSDFLILVKMPVFIYNSFSLGPVAGRRWCEFYGALGGLSGTSAIMTIAAMAIERYMSISKPLHPSSRMTRGRAGVMVTAIWVYSIIFSTAPLLGLNQYVPEGFLTSCSFNYLSDEMRDKIFIFSFFVAAWLVPLTIVCFSYFGMLVSVRKAQSVFLKHAEKMSSSDRGLEKHRKTQIQLAKISFCLISLWTLSWTPYATVALLGIFTDRSMLTPLSSMIPALFCKMASVLDPVVYGLSNQKFKGEMYRRIKRTARLKVSKKNISPSHVFRTIFQDSVPSNPSGKAVYVSPQPENDRYNGYDSDSMSSPEKLYCAPVCSAPLHTSTTDPVITTATTTVRLSTTDESSPSCTSGFRVETVKVFFIPRLHTIKMDDDKLKITFRRSV